MDDEEIGLVCALVGDPRSTPSPGSTRGQWCNICAAEVWMSVRMKRFYDLHPQADVICARCSVGVATDDVEALPGDNITEAEVRHLQEWLRRMYGNGA
jgi:hypothetical protein